MPTNLTPAPAYDSQKVAERLQRLAERTARSRRVQGLLVAVESDDGALSVHAAAGQADADAPYFIASIAKMYTAAIIGQLIDEAQLRADDRLVDLLPELDLRGVHHRGGTDATGDVRLPHLLDQTSGLPDYFEGGVAKDLAAGRDRSYDIHDVVDIARSTDAEFAPGDRDGGRAAYSDTNYLLLTAIIEAVTGASYADAVQRRIATPLGLSSTYVFDGGDTSGILPLRRGSAPVSIPQALASEQGAGGVVSTLDEQLRFSRAFHAGELFDLQRPRFNRVFANVDYGGGMMRFQLPRWMTLGAATPELIGHSGWTGTFLFYASELGVHLAGAFNQMDSPVRPFRLMPRMTRVLQQSRGTQSSR